MRASAGSATLVKSVAIAQVGLVLTPGFLSTYPLHRSVPPSALFLLPLCHRDLIAQQHLCLLVYLVEGPRRSHL